MTGRKKFIEWLGAFFAVMLGFTVLSRAADSMTVAEVITKVPQNQVITHKVTGSGKVEGTSERALFALAGLRVERVLAKEGQFVKEGDVLIEFSLESLQECMQAEQEKISSLTRRVRDLESEEQAKNEKKSYTSSRAQEDYNTAVYNGDINITNEQNAVNEAYRELEKFYEEKRKAQEELISFEEVLTDGETNMESTVQEEFSLEGTADSGQEDDAKEQALLQDIRAKKEALNQAVMAKNQQVTTAKRGIQDAAIDEGTDGSLENAKEELSREQESLEKLLALEKEGASVRAEKDGLIKTMAVSTGSETTKEAAVILYETGTDFCITGIITKEEAAYVEKGNSVEITCQNNKKVKGTVEFVKAQAESETLFDLSIRVSGEVLVMGEAVEFSVEKDQGPFQICVPLSALREENGRNFLYVTETQDTVLGSVLVARKREVTVLDKNESFAALEPGSLSSDQKVIIRTDREISEGSRVRLQKV